MHAIKSKDATNLVLHEDGPKDGKKILLIAGIFSKHTFWTGTKDKGFSKYLNSNGLRTFVLDNRGHGHSQPHPSSAQIWDINDWVEDIKCTIKYIYQLENSNREIVVVGHSAVST